MATKRFNTFSDDLKRSFGGKVQRISVDAGFTCPNRDGSLATEGCIFCGGIGSGSFGVKPDLSVAMQLEDGKEVMQRKYHANKFIAYFQAYSNTYAPLEKLRVLFSEALAVKDVVGLIVATRPDCLDETVLELLQQFSQKTYFWLEVGLQSIHDKSLSILSRKHDYGCCVDAITRAKKRGLRVCAHIILGVPGETRDEMLAMASELNRLGVEGVKIHMLHVMRGTYLEIMYREGLVKLFDRDEYVGLVCDFLQRLDPRILIHRLTGDGGQDNLVAPLWSLKKFEVLNLIDAVLEARDTVQGSMFCEVKSRQ